MQKTLKNHQKSDQKWSQKPLKNHPKIDVEKIDFWIDFSGFFRNFGGHFFACWHTISNDLMKISLKKNKKSE